MTPDLRANLESRLPSPLVLELLAAHDEAKRNFYLGGLRLSEVEGGRFCEAAFRILEHVTAGTFTPLGKQLNTDKLILRLVNLPQGSYADEIRLHIPRALRVVYDIRNNRDAAHLADGIDPNLQDATLVVSIIDWVLAEFIRLFHSVSADEAQRIVEDLVTRQAPVIEEFGEFLKVLNPKLTASDRLLVLLYQRGREGATLQELTEWVHPRMRANIRRTLLRLEHDRALVHLNGSRYLISRAGTLDVEARRLYEAS
jgi:hypothetical protein